MQQCSIAFSNGGGVVDGVEHCTDLGPCEMFRHLRQPPNGNARKEPRKIVLQHALSVEVPQKPTDLRDRCGSGRVSDAGRTEMRHEGQNVLGTEI